MKQPRKSTLTWISVEFPPWLTTLALRSLLAARCNDSLAVNVQGVEGMFSFFMDMSNTLDPLEDSLPQSHLCYKLNRNPPPLGSSNENDDSDGHGVEAAVARTTA